MKLVLSAAALLSLYTNVAVDAAGLSLGDMDSCPEQAGCLQVTVNEIAAKCGSNTCEYIVCWEQKAGPSTTECGKYGDVDYIGDMHKFGDDETTVAGGCVNEVNEDGKGFWDTDCASPADPAFRYSTGEDYTSRFKNICQIVSPGHTAHLLINDGERCFGTASIVDATGRGLSATCGESSSDSGNLGGQTFFPGDGETGGTCSDEPEGFDCVWSITVPQECSYEEADPFICESLYNFNDELVCPLDAGSVLEYYPNTANGPPPDTKGGPIIHDISFIDTVDGDDTTRTVSFRVNSPFGDIVDVYTVYHSAENGDSICNKDESIKTCPSDVVMEAKCFEDDTWTVVTVFVAGYGPDSETAGEVDGDGTEIYECCDTTFSPIDHVHAEYITGYTYLLQCKCELELEVRPPPGEVVPTRRVLRASGGGAIRVREDLSRRFLAGELFDDELKEIYGLN